MKTFAWVVCGAAIALLGCNNNGGVVGTSTLSGKVVMSDGSDPSGLVVAAAGPSSKTTRTLADGSYAFDKLADGPYVVAIEAADTQERALSFAVDLTGSASVPDATFHPVGRLTGTVTRGSDPVAGAVVEIAGGSLQAVTGPTGAFSFDAAPAGDATLIAHEAAHVVQQRFSGSASLKVKRGANDPVMLAVTDVTGTVKGQVVFADGLPAQGVKVAVSASVSATTDAQGHYELAVPVGHYTLSGELDGFPTQAVGEATIAGGDVVTVPAATLSLYRKFTLGRDFNEASLATGGGYTTTAGPSNWTAVAFSRPTSSETTDVETWLFNVATGERRLVSLGGGYTVAVSPSDKRAAWGRGDLGGVAVLDLETGKLVGSERVLVRGVPWFSSDDSVVFFPCSAQQADAVCRFTVASGQLKTYPASTFTVLSPDEVLVHQQVGNTLSLTKVTPTTDAVAATGVARVERAGQNVFGQKTSVFTLSCTTSTSCSMQIIAPGVAAPVPVSGTYVSDVLVMARSGNGEWFVLSNSITQTSLVRVSTGAVFPLPAGSLAANTGDFAFNYGSSGLLFRTGVGAGAPTPDAYEWRVMALPPPAAVPAPFVSVSRVESGRYLWLTDERLAFDKSSGGSTVLLDVKNGVATPVADVQASSVTFAAVGGGVSYRKASSKKLTVIVGGGAPVDVSSHFPAEVGTLTMMPGIESFGPTVTLSGSMAVGDNSRIVTVAADTGEVKPFDVGSFNGDFFILGIYVKGTVGFTRSSERRESYLKRLSGGPARLVTEPQFRSFDTAAGANQRVMMLGVQDEHTVGLALLK